MTPLHYNIENSKLNIELTKLLIEKGADCNYKNKNDKNDKNNRMHLKCF